MTDRAARPEWDAEMLLAELVALPEEARLARLRDVGPIDPTLMALGDAAERAAIGEVTSAVGAGEVLIALADAVGGPRSRARARRAQAQIIAQTGRFAEALPCAAEAVEIAEAAGEIVEAARARLASLQALASLARYAEALAAGEAARAAFVAAGEPALAARADLNLGATYAMSDDPATALKHYARARPALVAEPVILAQLETNRGNALVALDDFAGAEAAFSAAVTAFAEADLGWAAAVAEGSLAHLATRQGRLERALAHYERARRFLERDASPVHLARLLLDQGDAFAQLGLPDEALTTYEAVLPTLEAQGLAAEAAQARAALGRALVRLGRLPEAEAALDAAAAAYDRLAQPAARARVDLARAELAIARGRMAEARMLLDDALAALNERPVEAAVGRGQLARLALIAGDPRTAMTELTAALATAEALDLAPLRSDLLHVRGRLRRSQARPDLAMVDLRAAVAQVERVRGVLQSERYRAAFLGNRQAVYEDAVLQALDLGQPATIAEAFATIEQAKSRALLDLVGGALDLTAVAETADPADPAEAAVLAELARLRTELSWAYGHLEANGPDGDGRVGDLSARQATILQSERELDALQDRIAVARGVAGLFAPPLDLASAHALVPRNGALIEYFAAAGELLALVLRDGGVQVIRGLAGVAEVAERAGRFHFQVQRAVGAGDRAAGPRGERLLADVRRDLGILHGLVIAPLVEAIGDAEQLVIVPHGPLHAVPFQALWDGSHYLIEDREVRYAPSASLLAHLRPGPGPTPDRPRSALVVGVPDALAPQIAEETRRVAATLRTDRVLLGDEATARRVQDDVRDTDVVHLACHGRFLADRPLTSGLKLADRWLTVRDLYRLQLRASLVTLSGCETGRSAVGGGDELLGLLRGLYAAGAASLLVSLWTVNDASTAELMAAFYTAWQDGASKPAALRQAQCAVLADRPHPAFWAPFIFGGQP